MYVWVPFYTRKYSMQMIQLYISDRPQIHVKLLWLFSDQQTS